MVIFLKTPSKISPLAESVSSLLKSRTSNTRAKSIRSPVMTFLVINCFVISASKLPVFLAKPLVSWAEATFISQDFPSSVLARANVITSPFTLHVVTTVALWPFLVCTAWIPQSSSSRRVGSLFSFSSRPKIFAKRWGVSLPTGSPLALRLSYSSLNDLNQNIFSDRRSCV